MKKLILIIALITGFYGLSSAQSSNKIVIKVTNIKSSEGNIGVAVFNSEKTFLGKPFVSKSKKAKKGEMTFEIELPNGEYTISVMHDENKNGNLDKNFIGIPTEPYGISMDGRNMFGPPSYSDALFTISDNVKLTIELD